MWACVCAVLICATLGFTVAPAHADASQFTRIARIPVSVNDSNGADEVMLDPGARRLLYWSQQPPASIRAIDLDSFREVKAVPTSDSAWFGWALDARRHVLFHQAGGGVVTGVDTRTLATVASIILTDPQPDVGLLWSERDQLLYVVQGAAPVSVEAIDPYAAAGGAVRWQSAFRGCGPVVRLYSQPAVGETRDGSGLFVVCATPGNGGAVARLALPASPNTTLGVWNGAVTLYPGLVTGGGSSGSTSRWVSGSDRMVTSVPLNSGAGWGLYVFDADALRYVAAPALFVPASYANYKYISPPSLAVDPLSGRVYTEAFAITTQGRTSSGSPCQYVTPGSSSVAVVESSVAATSVLHIPAGTDPVYSTGHVGGFDPIGHTWWTFTNHTTPADGCNPYGVTDTGYIDVYRDLIPAAVAPPAADPDAGTAYPPPPPDVPVGVNATSDASAYGVRYLLGPSGAEGLSTNATLISQGTCDLGSYVSGDVASFNVTLPPFPPLPQQYHSFCNANGRTATFAHVDKVSLDASETRADAITGDTDRESARDLQNGTDLSRPGTYTDAVSGYVAPGQAEPCPGGTGGVPGTTTCDQAVAPLQPYVSGLALPYAPATCNDSGTGDAQGAQRAPVAANGTSTPVTYPGSASVSCSLLKQTATGHADQASTSAGGPLAAPAWAMTATADATATRNAQNGAMATSTSSLKDVDVGGVLHIAGLSATASVQARGTTGANPAAYTCRVTGLEVTLPPGLTLPPGVPPSIASAACDDANVNALVAAVNSLFTGVMHVDFSHAYTAKDSPPGGAGGVVVRQSPHGYLSEVAMSAADLTQNTILTNDTSIEEPALVATFYLDNQESRNRLVVSFAGVAAAARYGIYPVDNGSASQADTSGGADTGSLAGALAVLGPAAPDSGAPPATSMPSLSPPVAAPRASGLSAVPGAIADGVRFLLQHPGLIPPLLAVWLLFTAPGYVLARRRTLQAAIAAT